MNNFSGERVERDVHRDERQGRLQRQTVVQESTRVQKLIQCT